MEVDATSAEIVQAAFANRNAANAMDAQVALLKRTLDSQQQAAADMLKMLGLGQNLNALG